MPEDVPGYVVGSDETAETTSSSSITYSNETRPSSSKLATRSLANQSTSQPPPPPNNPFCPEFHDYTPAEASMSPNNTHQSKPSHSDPPPFVDHLRIIPSHGTLTLEWTFTPAAAIFVWPYSPSITPPPCTCGHSSCRGGIFVPEAWRSQRLSSTDLCGFTVIESARKSGPSLRVVN